MLILHILIMPKQIKNNACKLVLMLDKSKLMNGLFCQNLQTAIFYEENCCWVIHICAFIAVFLVHLSKCTSTIIGIDHYLRIKHHANLKASWKKNYCISIYIMEVFCDFLRAVMTLIGLLSSKEYTFHPVYFRADTIILGDIIFCQKIASSKDVCNEGKLDASRNTNK